MKYSEEKEEGDRVESPQPRLAHVAIPAQDPQKLAGYYGGLLGMKATLEGSNPALGDFVFVSNRPDEELQVLAIHTKPDARHVAFEVESLAGLKQFYADAKASGFNVAFALNHWVTLSLYFFDPEGNCVEVFWATGGDLKPGHEEESFWNQPPSPFNPADLERPEPELLRLLSRTA